MVDRAHALHDQFYAKEGSGALALELVAAHASQLVIRRGPSTTFEGDVHVVATCPDEGVPPIHLRTRVRPAPESQGPATVVLDLLEAACERPVATLTTFLREVLGITDLKSHALSIDETYARYGFPAATRRPTARLRPGALRHVHQGTGLLPAGLTGAEALYGEVDVVLRHERDQANITLVALGGEGYLLLAQATELVLHVGASVHLTTRISTIDGLAVAPLRAEVIWVGPDREGSAGRFAVKVRSFGHEEEVEWLVRRFQNQQTRVHSERGRLAADPLRAPWS